MEKVVSKGLFANVYAGKKVLVTGHTGFKGSWFCIWLKQLGAEVYGYALPTLDAKANFHTCGVENLVHHRIGDVTNNQGFYKYFTEVQPDIAFHFAAQPLVLQSYQDPFDTFQTNLMGVVNFFECVRKTASVKVAINVTSDKCYDNKEWIWGYRENDAMGGKDPYSASKGCAELITASYVHSFFQPDSGCRIASVRAGNVIGGGDWSENRVVPDFFKALQREEPLFVRNPNAIRPWQHVLEPLSGYLALASRLYHDSSLSGGWNFGPLAGSNHNVRFLIEEMIRYGNQGSCTFAAEPAFLYEANLLNLDVSKATGILKWFPVLNIHETVAFTVDGYADQFKGADLLNSRRSQINIYVQKAKASNISWANQS